MDRLPKLLGFLRANRALLIVAAIVAGGWFYLRTPATPLASVSALDQLVAQGEPVVLEFFGNT